MRNLESRKQLEADVAPTIGYLGEGYAPFDRIVKLAYAYIDLVADIEATERQEE